MRFRLPLPPSTNNLFKAAGKGRVKSDEYKAWREEAAQLIMQQRVGQTVPKAPYRLDVWCYFKEPTDRSIAPPPGSPKYKKRDATNYSKAPEDAIMEVLHLDDEDVLDACVHKRQAEPGKTEPRCVVYLVSSTSPTGKT